MRIRQIERMNVIANVRAIRRVIVVAENLKLFALSLSNLQNNRKQVRFRMVIFADRAVRLGTGNVEVAQSNEFDTVCLIRPTHDFFHHQLAFAVWIDRILRIVFFDRHLFGNSVRCSR